MKRHNSGCSRTMKNSDNEWNSGKSSTVDPPSAQPMIGVRKTDFVI